MLVKKTKKGDWYRIAMGPRALTASSGFAPWNIAVDRLRQHKRKNPTAHWVKGPALLGCLPLWGREGVTLAISTPAQKNPKGFQQSSKRQSRECYPRPGILTGTLNTFFC
jgi:hypothetical protein